MKSYLIALAIAVTVLISFISLGKADDIKIITLTSNDIIYDPVSQKIYASVPSSAGATGNSITIIDPFTGTVDTSIFIGSEPSKLAISNNGQYLYVALDGAASVRRFDITSQTAELQFALGSDSFFGPYYAEDIQVLPGNPETAAVSTKYLGVSPRFAGVGIYDNGIQRPTRVPHFSGTGEHVNVIEFSASSTRLYGGSTTSSPTRFYRMSVDTNGVSITNVASDIIPGGFSSGDIEFDGGLIYTAQGGLIDPEAQVLLGTFMLPSRGFVPLVGPDSSARRVYFLTVSSSDGTMTTFDNQTFLPIDTLTISGLNFDFSGPSSLIFWGRDALAFRTSGDQLVLVRFTLRLSTNHVSFASVQIGQFADALITIKNTRSDTLMITDIVSDNSAFTAHPTFFTVAPNQTAVDTIRFSPLAGGAFAGTLLIHSNSPTSPDTVTVTGDSNSPPENFSLLEPQDGAILDTLNFTLIWQQALEVDPGDDVRYQVIISTQSDFSDTLLSASQLIDTTYTIVSGLQPSQQYYWKVIASDLAGAMTESNIAFSFSTSDIATAVTYQNSDQSPTTFSLSQNYPNPFNAQTVIKYQLPQNGQVELAIFNVLGQRVRMLVNEFQSSGSYQVRWHGIDELESLVTSGVYIIRLQSHSLVQTRKMIFLQ